jgi:hypothetical protein
MDRSIRRSRRWFLALGFGFASAMSIAAQAQKMCGGQTYPFPYTDVSGVGAAFCPGIMEAYVTGVSKGTTPTTFSPNDNVTRLQMTTFLQRSLDQGSTRASRRTVLKQLWQTNYYPQINTSPGGSPVFCAADGETIWVASEGEVDQFQASSGKFLGTWTGTTKSWPIAVIPGLIITADNGTPNGVYYIDPTHSFGPLSASFTLPGGGASSIAYDGVYIWIASFSGSVSLFPPLGVVPKTYTAGFSQPVGLVYDGTQMWVTDYGAGTLLPVARDGTIGTPVTVGAGPEQPAFDGENIWVPNYLGNSITVVQASSGKVVATILSDGINNLSGPEQASFDGERVLVTNHVGSSITLFKAADLSVIGNAIFFDAPYGVCSDRSHFWITFTNAHELVQY